jgi:hypothetical protein
MVELKKIKNNKNEDELSKKGNTENEMKQNGNEKERKH